VKRAQTESTVTDCVTKLKSVVSFVNVLVGVSTMDPPQLGGGGSRCPAIQPAPGFLSDNQGVDLLDHRGAEGDQEVTNDMAGSGHNVSVPIASTVQVLILNGRYSKGSGWRTVSASYHETWDTRESAIRGRRTIYQAAGRGG